MKAWIVAFHNEGQFRLILRAGSRREAKELAELFKDKYGNPLIWEAEAIE